MPKRFTDTEKYKKRFFRGLQGPYKVLWDYLYHDCNHAGIWIVDFEIAQIYIGKDLPVNKQDALRIFNEDKERILVINGGKKWFIPSFVDSQYGELNEENRVHGSVISILKKENLWEWFKGLRSPLQGRKDKDKDKDKEDKVIKKINIYIESFKAAWDERFDFYKNKYPGLDYELQFNLIIDYIEKHPKWGVNKDWNLTIQNWLSKCKPNYYNKVTMVGSGEKKQESRDDKIKRLKETVRYFKLQGVESDECKDQNLKWQLKNAIDQLKELEGEK